MPYTKRRLKNAVRDMIEVDRVLDSLEMKPSPERCWCGAALQYEPNRWDLRNTNDSVGYACPNRASVADVEHDAATKTKSTGKWQWWRCRGEVLVEEKIYERLAK